eukprot:gene17246-biopygen9846
MQRPDVRRSTVKGEFCAFVGATLFGVLLTSNGLKLHFPGGSSHLQHLPFTWRNCRERVPDASRSIDFEETDASRTCPQ